MERKYEELKNSMNALQRQYDQLLEKNQNDLIRIKKKEKQLDVTPLNNLANYQRIKGRKIDH